MTDRFTIDMTYHKGMPQGRQITDHLTDKTGLSVDELCRIASQLHSEKEAVEKDHERQTNQIKLLNTKISYIYSAMREAYQNERTALGKSVLKQLIDSIGVEHD